MYDHKSHSSYAGLTPYLTAGLEKHEEMMRNAIRWQQMSRLVGEAPKTATSTTRLRMAFTTLLNLLAR